MSVDKLQPYDNNAEEAVIGSLLIDEEAVYGITWLHTEDFFNTQMKWIYEACSELLGRGEIVNQITVAHELASKNRLEDIGGVSLLSRLISETPTSTHVESYARIVKNMATRRRVISFGTQATSLGYSKSDPIELMTEVEKGLLQIQSTIATPQIIMPKEWADMGLERYAKLNEGKRVALPSGFNELDEVTGGIFPGEYRIEAGYAGIGKTTIALQQAEVIQKFGNVLLCSMEMMSMDVLDRRVATRTGRLLKTIRLGNYGDTLYGDILVSLGHIAETNIIYYGQSMALQGRGITTQDLYVVANHILLSHGLKAIIIDYLQYLGDVYGKSDYERITYISRRLGVIARTLQVPVICLCQLNRDLMHRTDKRPRMSDLRGSGAIEADADVIIFLHRDTLFDEEEIAVEDKCKLDAELIVAKQRQGDMPNIKIDLLWDDGHKIYIEKDTSTQVPNAFR